MKTFQFPSDALEYAYSRYPVIVKKDKKTLGFIHRNIHIKLNNGLTLSIVKYGMEDEEEKDVTEIAIFNEAMEWVEIGGEGNVVEVIPDDKVLNVIKALEGLTGDLVFVPLNYLLDGGGDDQEL